MSPTGRFFGRDFLRREVPSADITAQVYLFTFLRYTIWYDTENKKSRPLYRPMGLKVFKQWFWSISDSWYTKYYVRQKSVNMNFALDRHCGNDHNFSLSGSFGLLFFVNCSVIFIFGKYVSHIILLDSFLIFSIPILENFSIFFPTLWTSHIRHLESVEIWKKVFFEFQA